MKYIFVRATSSGYGYGIQEDVVNIKSVVPCDTIQEIGALILETNRQDDVYWSIFEIVDGKYERRYADRYENNQLVSLC